MSFGTGPVSANTVVPWPVQPKPEPKTSPAPKNDPEKSGDGLPSELRQLIQGHPDRTSRDPGGSELGRFQVPKDEVELAREAGGGHREKAESFLDRSRQIRAPLVGQKTAGFGPGEDELSRQLRSNLTRSRLDHGQRRPSLR